MPKKIVPKPFLSYIQPPKTPKDLAMLKKARKKKGGKA